MQTQDELLTPEQASKFLNISKTHLAQMRMAKYKNRYDITPPYVKIGTSVRYPKSKLIEFINSNLIS